MKKISLGKLLGIALVLSIVITIYAANVNDTTHKNRFMETQSAAQIALAMTAYQQYIDAATSGTTITYKRYKSGSDPVLITRLISIAAGNYTQTYFEKTKDTWANKFGATYKPINE